MQIRENQIYKLQGLSHEKGYFSFFMHKTDRMSLREKGGNSLSGFPKILPILDSSTECTN